MKLHCLSTHILPGRPCATLSLHTIHCQTTVSAVPWYAEWTSAGPITLVSLAKADADIKLDVGSLVQKLVPKYVGLLQQLKELGVPEVL